MADQNLPEHGRGGFPIDPTKNVLDLVQAAMERQDDLREVWNEVYKSELKAIHEKFDIAERLRLENKMDSKALADAALEAVKELVLSQAANANEAMRQQSETLSAGQKGISNSLDDLKERVGKIEAIKLGAEGQKTDQRAGVGTMVGVVSGVVGLLFLAISIATFAINMS